jgi:hypothetical protein
MPNITYAGTTVIPYLSDSSGGMSDTLSVTILTFSTLPPPEGKAPVAKNYSKSVPSLVPEELFT